LKKRLICGAVSLSILGLAHLGGGPFEVAGNYHCENESFPEDTSVGLVGVDAGTSGLPNGSYNPTACVGNSGVGAEVDVSPVRVTLYDCPGDGPCRPIF